MEEAALLTLGAAEIWTEKIRSSFTLLPLFEDQTGEGSKFNKGATDPTPDRPANEKKRELDTELSALVCSEEWSGLDTEPFCRIDLNLRNNAGSFIPDGPRARPRSVG